MAELTMDFHAKSKYRWNTILWAWLILLGTLSLVASSGQPCDKIECIRGTQGVCKNDSTTTCECEKGWTGPACDSCGGRIK